MDPIARWQDLSVTKSDGILVGADQLQEWMLPWWWEHYQRHNQYPVAFVDFGLSEEMQSWCKERGELIALPIDVGFVKGGSEVDPDISCHWGGSGNSRFWDARKVWFKKPFALLQTPFRRTIWMDIDCEIRGNLAPLFPLADSPAGLSAAVDEKDPTSIYPKFNGGVIVYRRNTDLVIDWAKGCIALNHLLATDQEVLSHVIGEKGLAITAIAPQYNWTQYLIEPEDALIIHWHGHYGKAVIFEKMKRC